MQLYYFVVVFESKKCDTCDMVKNTLDSKVVSYFELNDEKAAIKVESV